MTAFKSVNRPPSPVLRRQSDGEWIDMTADLQMMQRLSRQTLIGPPSLLVILELIEDGVPVLAHHFRGRKLSDEVDPQLCRDLLLSCELYHPFCNTSTECFWSYAEFGLRLVDVKRRCVIPALTNCNYVALGYVW
jgi:hypothetical protein